MIEQLSSLDVTVLEFFNKTCQSPFLDRIVPFVTEFAHPVIFLAGLFLFFSRPARARLAGLLLLAGGTVSHYTVYGIKSLIQRPRPYIALAQIDSILPAGGYSCPSGHTTISFMAAFVLTAKFGKWYIFYTLALIVAMTRMYLGVHYPSDVIAGALLGSLIGYVLVRFAGGIRFRPEGER